MGDLVKSAFMHKYMLWEILDNLLSRALTKLLSYLNIYFSSHLSRFIHDVLVILWDGFFCKQRKNLECKNIYNCYWETFFVISVCIFVKKSAALHSSFDSFNTFRKQVLTIQINKAQPSWPGTKPTYWKRVCVFYFPYTPT